MMTDTESGVAKEDGRLAEVRRDEEEGELSEETARWRIVGAEVKVWGCWLPACFSGGYSRALC